jgi:hypothetical protein
MTVLMALADQRWTRTTRAGLACFPKTLAGDFTTKEGKWCLTIVIGVVSGREGFVGCFGNSRESGGTIVRTTYTLGPASPDNAEEGTEDDSPVSV